MSSEERKVIANLKVEPLYRQQPAITYCMAVGIRHWLRKQRRRCRATAEVPEASMITTPFLKCFQADHRCLLFFLWLVASVLDHKVKATGRHRSAVSGPPPPTPSRQTYCSFHKLWVLVKRTPEKH